MTSLKATAIHVLSTPGEVQFLVRGRPPEESGHPGDGTPVDKRIILSPPAAKQLAILLEAAVGDYEAEYGSFAEREPGAGPLPAKATRRGILESVRGEKARRLIGFIEGLGVHYGFEQSFKMLSGSLLGNRFLAGFKKDTVRHGLADRLEAVCRAVDMPESQLEEFLRGLPDANIILFGFEEGEKSSVYKAYLEFGRAFEQVVLDSPEHPASFLIHRGFKWDAADNARHTTARYLCHPSWSPEDILRRLADEFYGDGAGTPLDIVRGIVEMASRRMRPDEILYLEVEEEGNPRRSFDVNLYRANLLLGELYPFLLMMCRHFAIAEEDFHRLYEPVKAQIFGHLSGGVDRQGRDFLTVYYGVKGSSRRGHGGRP